MAFIVLNKKLFDIHYVNKRAKVVIVGISPGSSQSFNENYDETKDAKFNNQKCAFIDEKRKAIQNNLINMLDTININKYLGIESCSSLWSDKDFDKVNFISLLPFSTLKTKGQEKIIDDESEIKELQFIGKIDYKSIANSKLLTNNFSYFIEATKKYNNEVIYIACGPSVYDILLNHCQIDKKHIIPIVHPSGANSGRVKTYCTKSIKDSLVNNVSYQNSLNYRQVADDKMQLILSSYD